MARGLRRYSAIALVTFVGLGLSACGGGNIESNDSASGDCGELNIAVNPWTGYVSNASSDYTDVCTFGRCELRDRNFLNFLIIRLAHF